MKNILLCILLLSAFVSSAQKIRFTDKRNQWVYHCSGDPDKDASCDYIKTVTYGPDTVLFGRTYRTFITSFYRDHIFFPYCGGLYWDGVDRSNIFVREDTVANKVYWLKDSSDRILFDYNLHLGDTIKSHLGIIDSIICFDSIVVGSETYKVFLFTAVRSWPFQNDFRLIEGVGCLDWFLYPINQNHFEHEETLLCFSQGGYYPAITAPLCATVWVGFGVDTFRNSIGCVTLNVNEPKTPLATFSISPNPASSDISINSDATIQGLAISNVTGQVVMRMDCNSKNITASVQNLPNGIYFLAVRYGDGGDMIYHYQVVKD